MRLAATHPGVTVEEVIENTGFELVVPARVGVNDPPSETELSLLRELGTLGGGEWPTGGLYVVAGRNNQGSLFKLTEQEYEIIRSVIDEANIPAKPEIEFYDKKKAMQGLFLAEAQFDEMLEDIVKEHTDVDFILHGPGWWSCMSSVVPSDEAYPKGPITEPGRTPYLLESYENIYGDISAGSGYNALSRDLEFAKGFVKKLSRKLIYGTDMNDFFTPQEVHIKLLEGLGLTEEANEKMKRMLEEGKLDDKYVELETSTVNMPPVEIMFGAGMDAMEFTIKDMLGNILPKKTKSR
jgi:hypothetical protein